MRHELARRRALLTAALGLMRLRWRGPAPPAVVMLARWLNSWPGLGKLYRRMGKRQEAQEHLRTAATMYREMEMLFWLEQAEAAALDKRFSSNTTVTRRRHGSVFRR